MSNRTPTPWHFEELDRRPDGCGYLRCAADNLEISHHGDMGRSREENLANAAFIVKAVNSHDKLVEALKEIAEVTRLYRCDDPDFVVEIAREALRSIKEFAT